MNAVRHMPDEVSEAYAKATEEHKECQNVLKDFGPLCENAAPQTTLELS
jgi:hypothetical protein